MRACWLKWVGRDWSISADYIWLNYSGANTITPDDLIVFGIEPLFKEDKSNNKGNCYGHNDQKQDCQSMLLASFT